MSEIKSKKIKLFGTHHLVCSLANIKKMTFLYDKAFKFRYFSSVAKSRLFFLYV